MFFGLLEIVCQLRYIDMKKHRSLSQTCSRILRLLGLVRLDGSSRVRPHRLDQSWSARGGKSSRRIKMNLHSRNQKTNCLGWRTGLERCNFCLITMKLPWNFMHSHDRGETDESLACVQSVVLGLAVKKALFRKNTKDVSQKHSQDQKKKWPQVHSVPVRQIRVAIAGDGVICADTGLVSTSERFGIMHGW